MRASAVSVPRVGVVLAAACAALSCYGCGPRGAVDPPAPAGGTRPAAPVDAGDGLDPFQRRVLTELRRQVGAGIRYQDGYYVGGEPPAGVGVCTDVVIRAFWAAGVDLRRRVAEDVRRAPGAYRIGRPDANIDHRRCRNLIVFLGRHAMRLPAGGLNADWQPGDIVFWSTAGNGRIDHVGVVAEARGASGERTVVHHWPGMAVAEADVLHSWAVMGHFRWPRQGSTTRRKERSPWRS